MPQLGYWRNPAAFARLDERDRAIGGLMRILSGGIVAAALLLCASETTFAAEQQCNLTEYTRVDMTYDRAGGPLIPATINGQTRSMLVDTGSIFSMVTAQTVDDLKLHEEQLPPRSFELIDGKPMNLMARVNEIIIGQMRGKDWSFLVMPQGEDVAPEWAGTIGPDITGNYDIEFDFGAGKFAMFSPDHCRGEVVYWTKDGYAALPVSLSDQDDHIRLTAMLDGKPVHVVIDTGTSTSIMNFGTAHELFGIATNDPALKKVECASCGSDGPVTYPFKTLSFGGVTVLNPNIDLYPDTLHYLGTSDEDEMIVGMSILRQLHLYLSYREKTLYVTPAGSH